MHSQEARSYVKALEAERMKMLMFKSELPLSIDLVTKAIESCRENMCDSLSEETTSNDVDVSVPVLEFIPIKKCINGTLLESEEIRASDGMMKDKEGDDKLNWLSSAQLWNMSPELPSKSEEELAPKELEEKKGSPKHAESSSAESGKNGEPKKDDKERSLKRKQRRCWFPDLHRKFLHCLKELGGAHVATPKQIRELIKVDGLTNDEVKSHLQKYRLYTRRPTPPPSQRNTQTPQFVVIGSIWAPQSDSSTLTLTPANNGDTCASRSNIYTPMAAPPPPEQHSWHVTLNQKPQIKSKNSEGRVDGLARCIFPSMSSSTRTTASHVY